MLFLNTKKSLTIGETL